MVNFAELRQELDDEVSIILHRDFDINITKTFYVPHSGDGAITFPNFDDFSQGTKILETTVLYVDMRRSTELSLTHDGPTVAKLYSSFIRAVTSCAQTFRGHVRGIIGDRVMVLFDTENCYKNAVDTAQLINSVCKYVISKNFAYGDVSFGIGIDHGKMLATKTGIRRLGHEQHNYKSLVWLGRPANIASKLTDNANKPELRDDLVKVNVAYDFSNNGQLTYIEEYPHTFVKNFYKNAITGQMHHSNNAFRSFYHVTQNVVTRPATPPILMTKKVFDGLSENVPNHEAILNGWYRPKSVEISEYDGQVYGGDVYFKAFKSD